MDSVDVLKAPEPYYADETADLLIHLPVPLGETEFAAKNEREKKARQ